MENSDSLKKKWIKVYPNYIDKAIKHSEGRKVSNAFAVESPSAKEIFGVCAEILNLNSKLENVMMTNIKFSIITHKII